MSTISSAFRSSSAAFVVCGLVLACSSDDDGAGGAADDDSAVCASSLFCDDFEAFAPGAAPGGAWTPNQNNGVVSVDSTRAFRGALSVKATTLATSVSGQTYKAAFIGLTQAPIVPVPNQAYYGRMMFYLESAPSTDVHWTIIDTTGLVPGQEYSATYRYGGQLALKDGDTFVGNQLMANYDTTDWYQMPPVGPNTDCYRHSDRKVVPVGEWACAEWFFDGPNAQMRFWLDGTELTDLAIDRSGDGCVASLPADYTWEAPTFSRIDVGWESYQTDDERSIWIDDVVISSAKVGCPAMR